MKASDRLRPRLGLVLLSVLFVSCLAALASIKDLRGLAFPNDSYPPQPPLQNDTSPSENDIRVLIGVLTLPDHYNRRHFLRTVFGAQLPVPGATFDVKFVFCNLTKDDQRVLVALEIMRYDDVIILNCAENMNNGKTYSYFSSLPEILNDTVLRPYPPYHYVMKADDDIYLRLPSLAQSLRPLAREDMYYGFVIPCSSMNPFVRYMSGMGYLVSWDLVEWIRESEIPRNNLNGPEDRVFGDWIRAGNKGKNRFNAKWSMYNIADPPGVCTHEFWPETIAVHLLKNQDKWVKTLNYFNVTRDLKPSKMYHIP